MIKAKLEKFLLVGSQIVGRHISDGFIERERKSSIAREILNFLEMYCLETIGLFRDIVGNQSL